MFANVLFVTLVYRVQCAYLEFQEQFLPSSKTMYQSALELQSLLAAHIPCTCKHIWFAASSIRLSVCQSEDVQLRSAVSLPHDDRLERLELMYCGRPFGDEAATTLSAAALSALRVLTLGGAYRLSDASLIRHREPQAAWSTDPEFLCCRLTRVDSAPRPRAMHLKGVPQIVMRHNCARCKPLASCSFRNSCMFGVFCRCFQHLKSAVSVHSI